VRYDVRFMFIAGYQTPDFRTISDFRLNHIDLIKPLLRQNSAVVPGTGLASTSHGGY